MSETSMDHVEARPGAPSAEKLIKPKRKGALRRAAGRIGLSVLALAGLAGAVKTYDHYVLEPARPAQQNFESPTFDPSAVDTHINANNSVAMTLDEAIQAAPPVWQQENKTLTIILPIKSGDNRIPTLHIEKTPDPYTDGKTSYVMTVDGLQAGDIIVSPMDGILDIDGGDGKGVVGAFFLYGKGTNGERLSMTFATTDLKMLIFSTPPPQHERFQMPVKMGDPIDYLLTSDRHRMFAGQIQIFGNAHLNQGFNLASTSDGKVIVLK